MFTIRHLAETGSTNDDAAALLGDPASAGLVLVADFQRSGRGRHGRAWVAPPGSSLLFTAILPRTVPSANLWAVPFWTALGVAEGVAEATGIRVGLQWPNDLLLDERKCCGILCVSRVLGGTAWVGCGVGLNVRRPADEASTAELAEIVPQPAFLSDSSPEAKRTATLDAILSSFARRLPQLHSPQSIAREWEIDAELAGSTYNVILDGESQALRGTALRLGPAGELVLRNSGCERMISLADARVLR